MAYTSHLLSLLQTALFFFLTALFAVIGYAFVNYKSLALGEWLFIYGAIATLALCVICFGVLLYRTLKQLRSYNE